jgi:hypothetical protein
MLLPRAASAASCPNEAIRVEQQMTALPDCMALEMVSPPQKYNYRAGEPTNPPSISSDGNRILFESPAALAGTEGLLSPLGDRYVASRASGGWVSAPTSPPASFEYGFANVNSVGFPLSLTPDFGTWLSLQNTVGQAQNAQMTAYEASLDGGWTARSPLLTPLDGHHGLQQTLEIPRDMSAVSADRSHLFIRPVNGEAGESSGEKAVNGYSTTYIAGDPQPRRLVIPGFGTSTAATWNTYVLTRDAFGGPEVSLLARDENGKAWGGNCGTVVGGGEVKSASGGETAIAGGRNQGAVSVDGRNVLFSTRPLQPQSDPQAPTYPRCAETGSGTFIAGTATIPSVVTTTGVGTTSTSAEPEVVRGVTTTSGDFTVGQTVTLTGSTVAAGTTISAIEAESEALSKITLSNPVTAGGGEGKALKAGAQPFAVGEEVTATTNCTIPAPAGPCFAPGTTITAVNGQSISVSPAPLKTGPAKTIVASPPLRIMQRHEDASGQTTISELIEGGPAGGNDYFEGASVNQNRIYFTSSRALAGTDVDSGSEGCSSEVKLPVVTSQGCDLYLYERLPGGGHELIQVSAGGSGDPTPGKGADVIKGVVQISGDGSHAYFGAEGVLTTVPNPEGAVAQAGKLNLYMYERDPANPGGRLAFIGELQPGCVSSSTSNSYSDCKLLVGGFISYWNPSAAVPWTGPSGGGDGHILVFESTASLTSNDQDGGHLDIFRYDAATESLTCISCRPEGPDSAAFDVALRTSAGATNPGLEFAERQSWVSEAGSAIVFSTEEPLLPQDTDGGQSDYLWRAGELSLLPGTGAKPALSHDGGEVAFETAAPLLPQDGDSAVDVYLARAGGGFPNPPPPAPTCQGEACQAPLSPRPGAGVAPTESFRGKGNVVAPRANKHRHKHRKRHTKHRKKHGKQVKSHRKPAGANKGGSK